MTDDFSGQRRRNDDGTGASDVLGKADASQLTRRVSSARNAGAVDNDAGAKVLRKPSAVVSESGRKKSSLRIELGPTSGRTSDVGSSSYRRFAKCAACPGSSGSGIRARSIPARYSGYAAKIVSA